VAISAVAGATSGLAGPQAGMVPRGAIDSTASVGGQVISNAIEGKPLGMASARPWSPER
jgi:hypothetical protein